MNLAARRDLPGERVAALRQPSVVEINPTDTLQYRSARQDEDERHLLQLEVIRRALRVWSNPGDTLLSSPFVGIGSEGHCASRCAASFVGAELKASYYQQAARNLQAASVRPQLELFG